MCILTEEKRTEMQAVRYFEMSVNCFQYALFNIPEEYNNGRVKPVCWDCPVGIAIRYWLDGPGTEFLWAEIFRTRPDRPAAHSAWVMDFPRVKAAGVWRSANTPSGAKVKERVEL